MAAIDAGLSEAAAECAVNAATAAESTGGGSGGRESSTTFDSVLPILNLNALFVYLFVCCVATDERRTFRRLRGGVIMQASQGGHEFISVVAGISGLPALKPSTELNSALSSNSVKRSDPVTTGEFFFILTAANQMGVRGGTTTSAFRLSGLPALKPSTDLGPHSTYYDA